MRASRAIASATRPIAFVMLCSASAPFRTPRSPGTSEPVPACVGLELVFPPCLRAIVLSLTSIVGVTPGRLDEPLGLKVCRAWDRAWTAHSPARPGSARSAPRPARSRTSPAWRAASSPPSARHHASVRVRVHDTPPARRSCWAPHTMYHKVCERVAPGDQKTKKPRNRGVCSLLHAQRRRRETSNPQQPEQSKRTLRRHDRHLRASQRE
jgi:hypothetical protein